MINRAAWETVSPAGRNTERRSRRPLEQLKEAKNDDCPSVCTLTPLLLVEPTFWQFCALHSRWGSGENQVQNRQLRRHTASKENQSWKGPTGGHDEDVRSTEDSQGRRDKIRNVQTRRDSGQVALTGPKSMDQDHS